MERDAGVELRGQSRMMRAMEGWERVRLTVSVVARLRVAFHQLSKTTPSVGHWRPREVIRRVLSGLNREMARPVPMCSSQEPVMAKAVE